MAQFQTFSVPDFERASCGPSYADIKLSRALVFAISLALLSLLSVQFSHNAEAPPNAAIEPNLIVSALPPVVPAPNVPHLYNSTNLTSAVVKT